MNISAYSSAKVGKSTCRPGGQGQQAVWLACRGTHQRQDAAGNTPEIASPLVVCCNYPPDMRMCAGTIMPPTAGRRHGVVKLPVAQLAPLQLLHKRDAAPGVQQPRGLAGRGMPKELQQHLQTRALLLFVRGADRLHKLGVTRMWQTAVVLLGCGTQSCARGLQSGAPRGGSAGTPGRQQLDGHSTCGSQSRATPAPESGGAI